jgi:hypothetical protein
MLPVFALLLIVVGIWVGQVNHLILPTPQSTLEKHQKVKLNQLVTTKHAPRLQRSVLPRLSKPPSAERLSDSKPLVPTPAELRKFILSTENPPDSRRQALQALVIKGPNTLAEMATIAQQPLPNLTTPVTSHSANEQRLNFEIGLRITAIETMDQWASTGTDVWAAMNQVRKAHTSKELLFLVNLALDGIRERKPGQVSNWIDQAFRKVTNDL